VTLAREEHEVADVTADRGADPVELPEVRDYLDRLRAAGRDLPPDRLDEVLDDVRAHVHEAVAAGVSAGEETTVAARNTLERLGAPTDIIRAEAEQSGVGVRPPPAPGAGPGAMVSYGEPLAIFLLMFGGFLFGVGWLVGVALLWISPTWRLREKLLGTFVWPLGYLGLLFLGGLVAWTQTCVSSGTAAGGVSQTCTGGPPYPSWVGVPIGVVVIAAPVLVAVALWRRRQRVLVSSAA
jgi:uncharacterized membrane protein